MRSVDFSDDEIERIKLLNLLTAKPVRCCCGSESPACKHRQTEHPPDGWCVSTPFQMCYAANVCEEDLGDQGANNSFVQVTRPVHHCCLLGPRFRPGPGCRIKV